jgi:serine/threonine-protein kinase
VTVAATLLDGRYLLDEEIGAGGFCAVWRATDTLLARPVAVKLLHAAYAHQPEAQARFKAEALHAGALEHKNVARVYDYGEPERGESYLVMELIEGPALDTVLADGPLDAARTMDVVAQVAAGLQAAHSAGLIHRDIKPSNIMFTSDGTVRITDFGVAHSVGSAPLTATGMVVGSPGYIAPERVTGGQGGPASDLYALGIVAYECLTGGRPFSGPPLEVAIAHRDRPLPPLPARVPVEVADFVMILTAKDPAWRPASAGEVACQARWLRDEPVSGAIRARPACADTPLVTSGQAPGTDPALQPGPPGHKRPGPGHGPPPGHGEGRGHGDGRVSAGSA